MRIMVYTDSILFFVIFLRTIFFFIRLFDKQDVGFGKNYWKYNSLAHFFNILSVQERTFLSMQVIFIISFSSSFVIPEIYFKVIALS